MSLAHVMRQTRGVGDEERGYCLMSWLPKRISLQPTRHPRANSREKSMGITPQCGIGSGSQTGFLAYAPSKRDRSSGIALIEELRSESLKSAVGLPQIVTGSAPPVDPDQNTPAAIDDAKQCQSGPWPKAREEGGRDYPLKLGPEFAPALFRSGTTSMK